VGSTIYGLGLMLGVVLAGMSGGALIYASRLRRLEPRLSTFTWVTALQAIAVLVPYALGDRLGYLALVINESLRGFGFASVLTGWVLILAVIALVPSVLAGMQLPMLVSLLGRGHNEVSRDLGRVSYWIALGAIAGTLLSGFVLIPMLSATQSWVIVAALIAGMSALSFMLGRTEHEEPGPSAYASFAALAGCIGIATLCNGPTAAWLEAPISYGQLSTYPKTSLTLEQWKRNQRRQQVKSLDGRDANIAVVSGGDQHSLVSNGRHDGSALADAPTQVMLGLVGGILHPRDIQQCCVVGLGTGSTAGWLAAVPSVKRVDVIDIESSAADLAREFSTVNRHALENSKVRLIEGDGREVLQMPGRVYDLIAARSSTPSQLGTANLYTLEFYQSARERLAKDGLFCQWVQGYDTDPAAVKLIMSTLCAAFEKVEVWNTHGSDLVFVCSPTPTPWDATLVRKRLGEQVYGEACARLWHANSAEGFFSRCIGNAIYTRLVAIEVSDVNSDDRNQLEFAASRMLSLTSEEILLHIFSNSAPRRFDIASVTGPLDRQRLAYERCDTFAERADILDVIIRQAGEIAPALRGKKELDANAYVGDHATYLSLMGSRKPQTISEKLTFAIATALTADARASEAAAALEKVLPDSQPLITAMRVSADRRPDTEALALGDAIAALRRSPWIDPQLVDWLRHRLVTVATVDASRNQRVARQLFDALRAPLVEGFLGETRSTVLTLLSNHLTAQERLLAIDSWGKHYPFTGTELATRFVTYAEIDHPGLGRARADLQRFLDYGGKVPQTLSPVVTALLSIEAGQEVAVMREYHKQQTAAVTK
jgi:spermidine synthase